MNTLDLAAADFVECPRPDPRFARDCLGFLEAVKTMREKLGPGLGLPPRLVEGT